MVQLQLNQDEHHLVLDNHVNYGLACLHFILLLLDCSISGMQV